MLWRWESRRPATWIADGAAKAFFTTLLTNPLFWIALAVGVVVAALYRMIQAVGGVKNAWGNLQSGPCGRLGGLEGGVLCNL